MSRPARARGLKQRLAQSPHAGRVSRPARARGLKLLCLAAYFLGDRVAPRTGAWIETTPRHQPSGTSAVAPRTGAWIETCRQS